jgi:invasion protein IalB
MTLPQHINALLAALALATGMATGTPGAAQEAAAAPAAETTDESPTSVQEIYRDWVVSCATPQGPVDQVAARVCQMSQELRQAEGNQRVLTVALEAAPEGDGVTLLLLAPFGLQLSQPIAIDLLETRVAEVPFKTCLPAGCIATTALDTAALDLLKGGEAASVRLTSTDGQILTLTVSLNGFIGALNRIQGTTP